MRTELVTYYRFGELSDEAQEKATEDWRNAGLAGDAWGAEWRGSLKKFEALAPIDVIDVIDYWSIDPWGRSFTRTLWYGCEDTAGLTYVRAWKWLENNGWFADSMIGGNCPFTGYYGDEVLLDAIRRFKSKPEKHTTLCELFQECVEDWRIAWEKDIEYQNSDEAIREALIANEYEFTEDGKRI